ncbi:hypothetical protein ACWPKS_08820 [Coraliomargarita sp. W4R72]
MNTLSYTSVSDRKKLSFKAIALLALSCGCSLYSNAELVAIDDFNSYTAGDLLGGENGGSGWNSAWAVGSGSTANTASAYEITYTSGGGAVYGGGNSFQMTGNSTQNSTARTVFATPDQTGQDYFVSFIFQVVGPTGTETGQTAGNNAFNVTAKGTSVSTVNDNLIFVNNSSSKLGARNDASESAVDAQLQYATTYLAVVKYTGWDAVDGVYESTQVWLNPESTDELSVDPTITASITVDGAGADGFTGFAMRTFFADSDHKLYIDDLRVATTWDAVVIPEPTTSGAAFGVVGLMAVTLLRRCQK